MLQLLKQTRNAVLIITGFILVLLGVSNTHNDSETAGVSIGSAHADAPSCTSSGEGCGSTSTGGDSGCGSDCGGGGCSGGGSGGSGCGCGGAGDSGGCF